MDAIQIGTMVDTGAYDKKEKTECPKKTLSKNTHHRAKRNPQKDIPRGNIQVSSSNKKGKTKTIEGILQLNTKHQSVEHSLQDSNK